MQTELIEVIDGITYTLSIEPDDLPIEGNASAIDEETDREQEKWITDQLQQGNAWAWCVVTVTARVAHDGYAFEGSDYLGGCSYTDRQQFTQVDGDWEGMKQEAKERLKEQLLRDVIVGGYAEEILKQSFGL